MLLRKILGRDPSVVLFKPDKASKSYAWLTDCFLLIYHNSIKQSFVFCKYCSNLITYNSIHGTGSLLRHLCYRRQLDTMKIESNTQHFTTPLSANKRRNANTLPTEPTDQDMNASTQSAKCVDISKQKKEIEEMIANGDPTIDIRPPANIKSDVWSNGNFKIIYRNGAKLDFVKCLLCNSLITYRSKTGTASLLRHSCMKNIFVRKMKTTSSNSQSVSSAPLPVKDQDVDPLEEVNETVTNNVDISDPGNNYDNSTGYDQYIPVEFPDEFKDEATKLLQYFSFKDMQPANVSNRKGFLSFAQYLINIGAEYGKVNIENVLDHRSTVQLADNFNGVLQAMLKSKLEEHKMCLSIDYWTDHNRNLNLITLYGHFIDEFYELKKVNLGTVSFTNDFDEVDYKQHITTILENYFTNENEVDGFLSKTTVVGSARSLKPLRQYSTINCACLSLNRIVREILNSLDDGFKELIPSEVLGLSNWSTLWDYLENIQLESNSYANQLINMLLPFKQALKCFSADQKSTINEVFIFRKKLEDHFKNARYENENIRNIALSLIEENLPITNLHKISIFLDPRFKSLKFMSHEEKQSVINMTSKMIAAEESSNSVITLKDESAPRKTDFTSSSQTEKKMKNDRNASISDADSSKYLIEYMDINEEQEDTHDEVEMYLNLKFNDIYSSNILEFWESRYDLPQLRQLAKEILCIPATAVVDEKIFSEEATLFTKRRLNMEIENLSQMLYIHENFDMLSNVL